ncbi:MAG: ABC transporter substrate-binding protein [Chromatiales bacterium]|nr:ABC transporter substrate-binding protein [Chromatiales bacterium]
MKRLLQFAILLFGLNTFSVAQASLPPHQMLEDVTQELFTVLKAEQEAINAKHEHLFELVERVLLPHVDLDVMSRYVLGKNWRSASEEQRSRFTNEFKNLMVRFYVSALLEDPAELSSLLANTDNLISYLPVDTDADTKKTRVRAEVHLPNGGPRVPVSFSLFMKDNKWMMYDVNVDGISLVNNYRSSFTTEVKRDGMDALIERIASRNQELLQATRDKQAGAKTP